MKKYISSILIRTFLLFLAIFSGSALMAANTAENAAASDSVVFALLIALVVVLLFVIMVLAGAIKNVTSNKELWQKKSSNASVIALLLGSGLLAPENALAAGGNTGGFVLPDNAFYLLLVAIAFLFAVAIFLALTLKNLLRELSDKKEEESFITRLTTNLTEAVPVEQEGEVMTDHEYDGIRELDNVLPPWWVYLFYATIIFAVVYLVRYHVIGSGNVMVEEYQAQVEEAALLKAAATEANPGGMIDENNVELLTSASDLDRGKSIYEVNCASCHRNDGGGEIGPNLTDAYWIHGGSISDIFSTIKYGVPDKGMISWEAQIKPDDMQRITSYIMSMGGSNPPGPKAPQGDLYAPEEPAPAVEEAADTTAVDTVTSN